jgi:hypothetical protein
VLSTSNRKTVREDAASAIARVYAARGPVTRTGRGPLTVNRRV